MVTKLALLGAGRIGKVHAKAIAEDKRAKLVAVADAFADAANAIAAQTGCAVKTIEEIEAYKDIDAVMAHQRDLVEIVHTLKQVLCIKG